jgi:hypothetical protein
MMAALLGLQLLVPVAAACEPVHASDLGAIARDGEAGVADLDVDGVASAVARLDAALPCVVDRLEPTDVAAVHRLRAFGYFVAGDIPTAREAFGAARGADPAWVLDDRLAPPGTQLREVFNTASLDVATEAVPLPSSTALYVDGIRTAERSIDRPALLQLVSAEGRVLDSVWLPDDQPIPDWSRFAAAVVPQTALGPARDGAQARATTAGSRSALGWWIGGGVAVAAAAGMYGWALVDHSAYVDLDSGLNESELSALRSRTNTKVLASGGLGVIGLGLGVVAIRW